MDEAAPQNTDNIVVRFAGDSGDGVQLVGSQFTTATALAGNDLATFPDFPAEIRAPAGTTFGVSAYQINFGSNRVTTPGDEPNVLVAFNPAALAINLDRLSPGAQIILDQDAFTARNLQKAGLEANPLEDGTLDPFRVLALDISRLNMETVKPLGLGAKDAGRCKNFWALGLVLWMFGRKRQPTIDWINTKFAKKETIRDANLAALNAGHSYGETAELSGYSAPKQVAAAQLPAGEYRTITGSEALALGLAAAGELADLPVMFCSYPITPASPILHHLARMEDLGCSILQAEDEIAAACAAIGCSYSGALGVTSSSGPGIALKTEAIGLAVAAEIPLVIVNSQRGGPSTGLPTKTEQSDLYQAVYGRNGDTPLPVIASRAPGDCFEVAIEAARIAVRHMTPVILLTDGFIANSAEPWLLPDMADHAPIDLNRPVGEDGSQAAVFNRDPATLGRVWAVPSDIGWRHRIGGIERDIDSGHISYDASNHQQMSDMRAEKVEKVADFIPPLSVDQGPDSGPLAIVGWGSTYGAIHQAVARANAAGGNVAHIHLRHIAPLPKNTGELLRGYDRILVPEMNMGQLATLLRDKLEIEVTSVPQVTGQPFTIAQLTHVIENSIVPAAAE